jgi:hypothetical protein
VAHKRRVWAVDCETDPAKHGRIPVPFIWGAFDGTTFLHFHTTEEFVAWAKKQNAILYAHNGGKFDFMFLIIHVGMSKAQVINGRIVKMNLGRAEMRDSYSIVTEKLAKFGKGEIDYRKMEADVRNENMDEIISYLKQDCVVLYEVVTEFRRIAGTQTTIAANALRFSRKLGVDPGKTNHTYDKNLRQFYYGGRCQVFQDGTHRKIRVLDINSAYPYAMIHDHACGAEWAHITEQAFYQLSREEQQRSFIHLRCMSRGAFPVRSKSGELNFPIGFGEYRITGWEFVAAIDLNLISDVDIIDCIVHEETINFSPYINHWYEYKAAHDKETQPVQYEIGKRMQNALYGKLAQDPARYYDYKIMPGGSPICYEFKPGKGDKRDMCCSCGERAFDHGWEIYTEYLSVEIHRRPSMWKWEFKYGKQWEGRPLYNNVATGASITGFTRSHLLRAIHAVGIENVIYCDTDSIICFADAPLTGIALSSALGDWKDEGTASIGHFVAKKTYGLTLDAICTQFKGQKHEPCQDCEQPYNKHGKSPKIKIASKGSRLDFANILDLMQGKTVVWKSEFPSFSVAGEARFVVRNIRQTAKPIPATDH